MSWCIVRDPAGCAFVEHHALVRPADIFVSRHKTITEAREALRIYRDRRDREEAIAAGQADLFGEGDAK